MLTIPQRLISNEDKVGKIRNNYCENCTLLRRIDSDRPITPGDELDAGLIYYKDVFGMSVNVFLCNTKTLNLESSTNDVNIVLKETDNTKFISNDQLVDYDSKTIEVEIKDSPILSMKIKDLIDIKGIYPFKANTPEETIHQFKLRVEYDPIVLNAFHFLVEVYTNQEGKEKWNRFDRKNAKKSYARTISTKIRAEILNSGKADVLNL